MEHMDRIKSVLHEELKHLPPFPWEVVVTSANNYSFGLSIEESGKSSVKWESQNLTGVVSFPIHVRIFGVGETGETFSKRLILTDGGPFPTEKELQDVCA